MQGRLIVVALIVVIVAFAFSAGCTLTVPGGNATVTPTKTPTRTVTTAITATTTAAATGTAAVTVTETGTATATKTATVTPTPTRTPAGTGAISGVKWNDQNGDHKRDTYEPVLPGWTITLEMQEANGPNWIRIDSTVTDANGAYIFTGLAQGHYRVYEVAQSGWTQTFPTDNAGMHNLVISNGQPTWTGQDFGNTGGAVATGTATATMTANPTATITAGITPTATATVTSTATSTATATVTSTGTSSGAGGTTYYADVLTARNIAFDKTTLTVPAGATVALTFVNDDAGVPHNFALYTDSSASTAIFKGAIVTGQITTVYTFTAPSTPGTYYYRCDVHPTQMNGQFIVT